MVTDRRRSILDASARLFRHYGAGKTTIADIAREASVAVGSVYLEFESKDAIVHELSKDVHTRVFEQMVAVWNAKEADPPRALVYVLLARTLGFVEFREQGTHACELVHCTQEGVKLAQMWFRDRERELFEAILRRGIELGVFRKVPPKETAILLQRAFASLSPPWIWSEPEDRVKKCARDMAQLLALGLRPE
jgi:AcrR family transcriptional regulator